MLPQQEDVWGSYSPSLGNMWSRQCANAGMWLLCGPGQQHWVRFD